ncbi:translin-associated factor X-interacting protein 1-like [Bicyclus anynana]|uniref:Translin-associated factor X-interacting protein 1-like n=1 Tax=Bicyclus anynana TaxID=110368 RepID=A0ABM3LXY3_BICAN|nr:translin-associated factor X-interacting protein 1-like [Bicyclus anynana]
MTTPVNKTVHVLDGGFSSQISRYVGTNIDGDPLWTARFLQTNPEDILQTHLDFLRAGADIISTNTYQASIEGFVEHIGVTVDGAHDLIRRAVDLAKRAREKYIEECKTQGMPVRKILIAGSVGPYGAYLHDGSEYTGDYADKTEEQTMFKWHKPRIDTLVTSGVDLLAIETIPCKKEALVLIDLLKHYPNVKAWISFSCKDDRSLSHGESFQSVARACWESNTEQLVAVGINCLSPNHVRNLIEGISDGLSSPIPIVTYPNSGEKYKSGIGWVEKDTCASLHTFIDNWLKLNVRYVGGCCRTYAEDIANIRKVIDDWVKKVFGISVKKKQRDNKLNLLTSENQRLKEENLKLTFEISRLQKNLGKVNDNKFSDYLSLMRERDARYTLYFENVALQLKLRELDGSARDTSAGRDPAVRAIALDRCREQLSVTQTELKRMKEEYAESVPRREHDALDARCSTLRGRLHALAAEHEALRTAHERALAQKATVEEELIECKEKCSELERAGTPRPEWELCGDFIGGGRERWWQLASGLSSRDMLRVLLKELGPAAESEHLEYFDGLGMDPVIPPYLRYEGRVRNLRLSRREIGVIINDIWLGKLRQPRDISMQDYVTHYFEERYQQPSVRAEWAYNLCAGAEQLLDEPAVKLFWGVLHGHLSEHIYWGHRAQWYTLKDQLYRHCKDGETITIDDFEKITRSTFPLKSEVDIKNLSDVVKKQLKLKLNAVDINLDKLFLESEEGFDRSELARELFRQRQRAQDQYIREVLGALGGRRARVVCVDGLKRAFAVVDPAINHIRMDRYIRWAFSAPACELSSVPPVPLRTLLARLAAGDIERVGPRHRATRRAYR